MLEIKPQLYNFVLVKNAGGKFVHTAKNPNSDGVLSKYLQCDCTVQSANSVIGRQSARVVKCVFEGSKVFDDIKRALEAGTIDKETGVSQIAMEGKHFRNIPVGFRYKSKGRNDQEFVNDSVSFFMFGDDNYEKEVSRARKAAAKTRIEEDDVDPVPDVEFEGNNGQGAPIKDNSSEDF